MTRPTTTPVTRLRQLPATPDGIRRRRQALTAWRKARGQWCPGWPPTGHRPHFTTDLLAMLAGAGGDWRLVVVCRHTGAVVQR